MTNSPGLRRKILHTDLQARGLTNSTFYTPKENSEGRSTSPETGFIPIVSLTKPHPYSPPMQRRLGRTARSERTVTKPLSSNLPNTEAQSETVLSKSTFYTPSVVATSNKNQRQGQGQVIEPGGQPTSSENTSRSVKNREPAFV